MNYIFLFLSVVFFGLFLFFSFEKKGESEDVVVGAEFRPYSDVVVGVEAEDVYARRYFAVDERLCPEDIGRKYELYVGFWLEVKMGYEVEYTAVECPGATVDLIARKPGEVLLVQCKYLSRRKSRKVDLATVCALEQAVKVFPAEDGVRVAGKIFTSNELSNEAFGYLRDNGWLVRFERHFALQQPYPFVKGVSFPDGRAFYYLPCDREYMRVRGCYLSSLKEARDLGFKRGVDSSAVSKEKVFHSGVDTPGLSVKNMDEESMFVVLERRRKQKEMDWQLGEILENSHWRAEEKLCNGDKRQVRK